MTDHQITDEVWEHRQNEGAGFTCNYCGCTNRGGRATQFKHHLAARGYNVKHCGSVPPDVQDYFHPNLNRTAENRRAWQRQSLLREEVAVEGNVVHNIDSDNDEELQHEICLSSEEAQYAWWVRQQSGQYEHGGGSSQQQPSGDLFDRLKRSTNRKGKSEPIQTRIDTGPWTSKSKQAKSTFGKAWAMFFHTEAITSGKADNPYFIVACKETQRWGKFFYLCLYVVLMSFIFYVLYVLLVHFL
jgi:hypothetical protein